MCICVCICANNMQILGFGGVGGLGVGGGIPLGGGCGGPGTGLIYIYIYEYFNEEVNVTKNAASACFSHHLEHGWISTGFMCGKNIYPTQTTPSQGS